MIWNHVQTSTEKKGKEKLSAMVKTMTSKALFFGVLLFSVLSAFAEEKEDDNPGLNNAFSWLRNVFHDCFVESCDASLLLDSTREMLSEKETDRSFGMRNFRYILH
ncbi:hypothetical protein H5410_005860 [Solanum commersonii]|uniref:Plant heme peroxidase family profile domain-containing protein n=1 Tax=Solanum commersonii TaxID=4109 RepID=A0A9J6A8M1_SOLCO|nr:hypothetical protein H5410_005860 [Solanum commersonii]